MPGKIFLYSSDDADANTVKAFKNRDYSTIALTQDPKVFWNAVKSVDSNGYLAILSHGDSNGFLMVSGQSGNDMTNQEIQDFAKILNDKTITLYLLSCHTGQDPFGSKLKETGCRFAAPLGYAQIKSSSESLSVYSVKDNDPSSKNYEPWTGTHDLYPTRLGKALTIR
ncbi:hypothetical protein [Burkholderia alba]|uniref:hypothetical protein n=1 Tax=Burkholderia alba TaxID=2683677 RepID=UPI002B059ACA|nr:hypothetical protein [Burkholderia alba]